MKWLVTVSPDFAAIPISIMLSTSYCWNQQSKLILLKLLKYSLQWCSLSVFSYEKYRILSVSSCQMHKPTATKKKIPKTTHQPKKSAPQSLLLEQSSSFIVRYASYKLTFHLYHPYTAYSDGIFFFCLSCIYIYLNHWRWKRNKQSGYGQEHGFPLRILHNIYSYLAQ